jgi:phosphinothricin acetyltransferase
LNAADVPLDSPPLEIPIRAAVSTDLEAIRAIYNQGIEDRCATLESEPHDAARIAAWWALHDDRYIVAVGEDPGGTIVGWASLNRFSHRCAHNAIADLSIYVARSQRGMGIGTILLTDILERARRSFRKIVLHALADNVAGKRLYSSLGFREVGIFRQHGELDGRLVDVIAMERLLT